MRRGEHLASDRMKNLRRIVIPLFAPMTRPRPDTDLIAWTEERALIATGGPFSPENYASVTDGVTRANAARGISLHSGGPK